jgi:hypothetical protein
MCRRLLLLCVAAVHAAPPYGPDYTCADCELPNRCTYGQYVTDPFSGEPCVDCPAGKYKNTIEWYDTECKACADGQASDPGSAQCLPITYLDDASTTPPPAEEEAYPATNAAAVGIGSGAVVAVAYYSTATT